MHVVLHTGVEALAALSMNHLQLSPGDSRLEVRLRSPDWADVYTTRIDKLFNRSEIDSSSVSNGQPMGGAVPWNEVNINLDGRR